MNPTGSHNQYIQILLETGIIGLLLYGVAFYRMGEFINKIKEDVPHKKIMWVIYLTQLFSVLSGEFWYACSIFCAQLILLCIYLPRIQS